MSGRVGFGLDDRSQAEAYIERIYPALKRAGLISPQAKLRFVKDALLLKFTGIGEKYRHHVYVYLYSNLEKRSFIVVVKPPYPMYLFPIMAPIAMFFYPACIVKQEREIRGIIVDDYERAVDYAMLCLSKYTVIEPMFFAENTSFEGYVYKTDSGYVAFEEKISGELFDVITRHREDSEEGSLHPVLLIQGLIKESLGLEEEEEST